ncbi:outer membrane protein transport protein [Vibrio sp. A2-1]|uniref:OmpP1/FadL family transporter n=1 Tax=Vibrio sp. A2-1 TaxID=2912252 RepID=UPI001F213655|nr:outer membrane protein transport protein [Vibrio sp. A2-1]MCF7485404.1 outer membrane protein transport protein [Vibrio sp. A2-1]
MKTPFITLSLLVTAIVSSLAHAGGLNLSQIATTKSVGTAGAGNVTANDASAVITNAAGLSAIEESAWILGVQYLDVETTFVRDDNSASTTGSSADVLPHLSYASRLNDQWVVGAALHAAGGTGVEYSHGVGAHPALLIKENSISALNLTSSLSYQVSEQLSLGGSLILQHAALETQALNGRELQGDSLDLGFGLSLNHHISDNTQLGVSYQGQFDHDLSLDNANAFGISSELTWIRSLNLGLKHSLNEDLNLLLSSNIETWQDYDDKYSTTYSLGVGVEYTYEDWLLYSGLSGDTSPVSSQNRDVLLPLDKQWRIGFGAEKKISNDLHLGLSYQYQDLGHGEINADSGLFQPSGSYSTNRVHFITLSLRH